MCYIVLSDIHANYTALKAVVDATKRIPSAKKFYFLGDLLGYGPASQVIPCIDWLRYESHIYEEDGDDKLRWVPGNHDEWAVTQLGRVRAEGSVTLLVQRETLKHARASDWNWFAGEVRKVLNGTPSSMLTETRGDGPDGLFMGFTHGGVVNEEQRGTYLYPWKHLILRAHFEPLRAMTDAGTKVLFCGHTHLPFLAQIQPGETHKIRFHSIKYGQPISLEPGEYIINPGSVGHPRDGDPRASFVVFDPPSRAVTFHRVEYNTRPVVDALQEEKYKPHDEAVRYLIQLDEPKIDLEPIPRELLVKYRRRIGAAYKRLIHEIETGDGSDIAQNYHAKVYRAPQWDLEAINSNQ